MKTAGGRAADGGRSFLCCARASLLGRTARVTPFRRFLLLYAAGSFAGLYVRVDAVLVRPPPGCLPSEHHARLRTGSAAGAARTSCCCC